MKENTVDIYLFGKKYTVPDNLTIMRAMEYAGYQLVRLRLPQRILRRMCNDLPHQRRPRTSRMSCLPNQG